MEWKQIQSSVCCNREKFSFRIEKTCRLTGPIPKKSRCTFLARWLGVDTGRERILRCDIHHLTDLLEEQEINEIMDAKMFVLPYVELQTPVNPYPHP